MSSQPPSDEIQSAVLSPPGVPVIRNVNWGGLKTLYIKEVRRFFKVQLQTIWAPAITTLLFLVIFSIATGGKRPVHVGGVDVPFADFIAPGLIVMGMLQNAYANSSFSLLVGKIQGTIVDYLMPPLSTAELLGALVAGAVTRAFCVGGAVFVAMLLWPDVHVAPLHPIAILWFGLLGSVFLALMGILTSIWAEKFDHAAAVQNFVIGPLTLLSGTFYSVDKLAPAFRAFSHFNPFFYIISGFRYGFLGTADSPIWIGSIVILAIDVALGLLCYALLKGGWRLKN
ncbi:MAG: multidrug transporter permease [Sphingomonas bacterium]|uniref:ABC transporter permease n=1 Tax=Sphingomonas bacterium TaxID=1895847 RepID=UPI00262DF423|nr:ABC transporter permease [Sphingomonas bacterium]MDB5711535.1 multidrug transporter permease [Sphingomonas bacterium]